MTGCYIFFHRWTPWHKIQVDIWDSGKIVAIETEQQRACEKCGIIKRRAF